MIAEVSKIQAVVFDLYNTLCANTRESWVETFKEICEIEKLTLDPADFYNYWKDLELSTRVDRVDLEDISRTREFIPYRDVWESCFRQVFEHFQFEANAESAARLCIEGMSKRSLFPESKEVVDTLASKYKIGLLSNADDSFLLPFLATANLPFTVAFSSEHVGVYKPHPKGFISIAAELGVEMHEVLFVGDTLRDDILGAQRVGMMTAYVVPDPSSHLEEFPVPDIKIRTVRDLLDFL